MTAAASLTPAAASSSQEFRLRITGVGAMEVVREERTGVMRESVEQKKKGQTITTGQILLAE
jgi:hypothetical protein